MYYSYRCKPYSIGPRKIAICLSEVTKSIKNGTNVYTTE
jgi:hypothetical protein